MCAALYPTYMLLHRAINTCTAVIDGRTLETTKFLVIEAILVSAFFVFFFSFAGTASNIRKQREVAEATSDFPVIHWPISLTFYHVVVIVPLLLFCACTILTPIASYMFCRDVVWKCMPI